MQTIVDDKYVAWVRENMVLYGKELDRLAIVAPLLKDSELRQCAESFIGLEGFLGGAGRFRVDMESQRPSDLKAVILRVMEARRFELGENITALQTMETRP